MKSSIKIILYVIVIALILLMVIILVTKKKEKREVTITIDHTEDIKGLGYSGQRKVAQDYLNNYFVTYRKKYQGKYQIFVTKIYYQAGAWKISKTDKPAVIVDSIADQRVPSIFISKNNIIYIVWYGSDGREDGQRNNRQIKFTKSNDSGSSWSEVKNISIVEGFDNKEDYWQEHPYLLADGDDNLYVVWEGKDKEHKNQQIKFSKSSDGGGTWTAWKNVLATSNNTQSRPTMVQTSNGRLHLFSYSSSGNHSDNQQIKYAWSDNNGDSWSQWMAITDAALDSRHVSAAGSGNSVHIAWRQIDDKGKSQIIYKVLNGENWSQSIIVNDSPNNQFFPSIAINSNKKAVIAWMENKNISGLPREDPNVGKVYMATLNENEFGSAVEVSLEGNNSYPNLPAYAKNLMPLVYERFNLDNEYDVVLKLF